MFLFGHITFDSTQYLCIQIYRLSGVPFEGWSRGVAVILNKRAIRSVVEWIAVNKRIMKIPMKTRNGHMTVI